MTRPGSRLLAVDELGDDRKEPDRVLEGQPMPARDLQVLGAGYRVRELTLVARRYDLVNGAGQHERGRRDAATASRRSIRRAGRHPEGMQQHGADRAGSRAATAGRLQLRVSVLPSGIFPGRRRGRWRGPALPAGRRQAARPLLACHLHVAGWGRRPCTGRLPYRSGSPRPTPCPRPRPCRGSGPVPGHGHGQQRRNQVRMR
jgi:hypothetical protein